MSKLSGCRTVLDDTVSYDFITSRLAVGNVASRAVGGFVAVVSLLATARSGILADELHGAPKVSLSLPAVQSVSGHITDYVGGRTMVMHIDLADDEGRHYGDDMHRLEDYLDDATTFIAAHLARGCVLVHCGAGKSRSVAAVVAYLCRYAGMSFTEALSLIKSHRPGAAPADCFAAAIKRWLHLDDLETTGPRR